MHLYHIKNNWENLLAMICVEYKNRLPKYKKDLDLKLKTLNLSHIEYEVKYVDKFDKTFLEEWLWAVNEKNWKLRKFN